ncbi:MAG: thioredoxin-dependent thiol peroxidase [Leucobacter sp.]
MTERVILEPGMHAPAWVLPDQNNEVHSLEILRGKKAIVFFYPAAMTPGCTKEACDFQESTAPLATAGYQVFGISRDATERLKRFAERDGLEFPLLSDPESEVHRAYGAFGMKNSYGRIIEGVIRSTFVIDESGKIEHALYNVKATGHVARVRKLLNV